MWINTAGYQGRHASIKHGICVEWAHAEVYHTYFIHELETFLY